VRPRSPPQPGPLIILLHPSGFFLPSHVKVLPHASGLAQLFGATVVAPRYRLAPEHPFPAGVDDAWAAVRWAVKNTAFLKVDLAKGFILGGMSTGSNFAVVLARRAIEEQLPARVTGVWAPLYMGFGPDGEGVPKEYASLCTSREHNKDAIVISGINAKNMYAHLKPDFDSRLFNILSATTPFNMSEFPRTYLQVAGADLFRDDSLILTSALRSHGVEVRLELYPGMPHSFWLWAAHLRQSQKCFRDIVIGFAWLLDVDVETLQEGWQEVLVNMGCVVDMKKAMEELGVTMGGDE
jgi:acetyl esterase/lipase